MLNVMENQEAKNGISDPDALWKLYEDGVEHHNRRNLFRNTEMAHRFFEGDQWTGLESGGENLPRYNFIQPTCEYKIAMVALKNMGIRYSPAGRADRAAHQACKVLNKEAGRIWETTKMDRMMWEAVKEACIAGDTWLLFYDERFKIGRAHV